MGNKVVTLILDTVSEELDSVLAAAVNEAHKLGHTVKEVRVMGDSGEQKVPVNTVPGVTEQAPAPMAVQAPANEPVAAETTVHTGVPLGADGVPITDPDVTVEGAPEDTPENPTEVASGAESVTEPTPTA
jgi:hypothetical protein